MQTHKAPQHLSTSKKWVGKILKLVLVLLLMANVKMYAQPWQQLGPGAGGQERAVYMYKNIAGNYVLYVGSDVSGVWRSKTINPHSILNPDQYQYEYISNHEITRFINKFCRPTSYSSDYLFVANRSGIDRIDLKNESNSMQNAVPNSEYWTSDIFICKRDPNNNMQHKSYFVTGNTRVDQVQNKTKKPKGTFDFYEFDLGQDELTTANLTGYNFPNFTTDDRDVFSLICDDSNTAEPSDDKFIAGTDRGLYTFNYTDLNSVTHTVNATYVAGPTGISGDYIVSSILKTDVDKYLVTIYGEGLFLFDATASTWTDMITTLGVTNACNDIKAVGSDVKQFTKLLPVNNPASAILEGFMLVHTIANVDIASINTYVGLYYCNQINGQPDGNWCTLKANSNPTNNDYGWVASKPCANRNGILLTNENYIITGKQGNIFISKDPLNSSTYTNMSWQQIYTASSPSSSLPCTDKEYNNKGYVNMESNVVFPETKERIWTTARDRLFWLDDGPGNSFVEIILDNTNNSCYSFDLTTASLCNILTKPLADTYFMQQEGGFLYAGIAEGFGSNQGNGYVIKNDITNSKIWTVEGNSVCGDPVKFFIVDNVEYLLVNKGSAQLGLYYLNGSTWTEITSYNWGNIRDVEMKEVNSIKQYYILASSGLGSQTIYHYSGDLSLGTATLECSVSNATLDINFEHLKFLPFNITDYKILIGGSPTDPPTANVPYFYELNSGNTCTLNPVPASNSFFKNLNLDKIDQVDEGVTALEVNTDRKVIYAATVSYDATQVVQVKSHLYKTTYNDVTGVINANWIEITNNAPNKTFTYLNSNYSDNTCNDQYVYACVRGLGVWKFEENPVLITTSNAVVCSGAANASATASNPFGSVVNYLWSNAQTTATATGLGAGNYMVTVTDGTCTASASVIISEDPNCCNTYGQYLYQANFNAGAPPITGDWNLNENITCNINITNANISISQGVHITVPNNVTVHIQNSTIFSCGNMWEGIINNGGTVIIDNSTIKDAQIACKTTGGRPVTVKNSHFDNNYISLYFENGNYGTAGPYGASVVFNSTFDNSTASLTKSPHVGEDSPYHIFISNVANIMIGDPINAVNTFHNGLVGIYSEKSNLIARHNVFNNIGGNTYQNRQLYPPPVYTLPNAAILAGGDGAATYSLTVGGNAANNELNIFNGCETGVFAHTSINTSISQNTFDLCNNAIGLQNIYKCTNSIVYNTITKYITGINLFDVVGNISTTIDHNLLNSGLGYDADNEGLNGINIQNYYPNFDNLTISYNTIENVKNAIHLRNLGGCLVCNINAITISTLNNNIVNQVIPVADLGNLGIVHYGVWAENCYQVTIKNNNFNWNNTPTIDELDLMRGISINNSLRCTLQENKTTKMGAGINFLGNCSASNLYCNTMESCYNGAYLQDASTIVTAQGTPTQSWNNKWVSNVGSNKVDGNAIFGAKPKWYYNPSSGTNFSPIPSNLVVIDPTPASSNFPCTAPISPMDEDDRERIFGETVRDSTDTNEDSAFYKQAANEAFFRTAKSDSTLLDLNAATDPLYQNKFEELKQSNIGKYDEVTDSLRAGNNVAALQKLTLIIDQNVIDENKKYLSTLIAVNYNPYLDADNDTVAVLTTIAYQHPFYGGEAVYWARAILRLDIEDAMPAMRLAQHQKEPFPTTPFILNDKLFPNPANNAVTFFGGNEFTNDELIAVYDCLQQKVMDYKLPEKLQQFVFDTSTLQQGVYVIKHKIGIEIVSESKLVIIK